MNSDKCARNFNSMVEGSFLLCRLLNHIQYKYCGGLMDQCGLNITMIKI